MAFTEIIAFLFTTPTGLSITAAVASLIIHGIGVKVPALSPLLNWIASMIGGGAAPSPAPTPGPSPAPGPGPLPIGHGELLSLLFQVGWALLNRKAAAAPLTAEEQVALAHVGAAADLHAPTPAK